MGRRLYNRRTRVEQEAMADLAELGPVQEPSHGVSYVSYAFFYAIVDAYVYASDVPVPVLVLVFRQEENPQLEMVTPLA